MSAATVFFLYVLPFVIAGLGWGAVLLNEQQNRRKNRLHPGE